MKKVLIVGFAILLTLIASLPLSAQENTTEVSINVSASVISSIEMITIQSMTLSEEDEQNGVIDINPQQSSNAGKMIAIGTPNSEIRISYLQQRELTRTRGSETLTFNYEVAGNSQDEQTTAEVLNRENRDFEFNSDGRFYIWIGGSVDITTATPGQYQGEFTLDIEYI